MQQSELLAVIDETRRQGDFLSLQETLSLRSRGNVIYDPFSTLISRHARIASGNIFYPTTMLRCDSTSGCEIGSGNVFHAGTLIEAIDGGTVVIGNSNTFGDGGFKASADRSTARIVIGNGGRYNSGASVYGTSTLGNGTQLLGLISVSDCVLEGGEGFSHSDPDMRGAVLKGYGAARHLHLRAGEVILGTNGFEQTRIQRQTDFHPKPPAG